MKCANDIIILKATFTIDTNLSTGGLGPPVHFHFSFSQSFGHLALDSKRKWYSWLIANPQGLNLLFFQLHLGPPVPAIPTKFVWQSFMGRYFNERVPVSGNVCSILDYLDCWEDDYIKSILNKYVLKSTDNNSSSCVMRINKPGCGFFVDPEGSLTIAGYSLKTSIMYFMGAHIPRHFEFREICEPGRSNANLKEV